MLKTVMFTAQKYCCLQYDGDWSVAKECHDPVTDSHYSKWAWNSDALWTVLMVDKR